jgi:uncharacterized protein YdgA (DUF945 family)
VKKGFVALLIGLAIVVLLSPGIVGRLAEQSMDENLDWAATESQEVIVTSQGFDRGWFSSAGQHRIELRDGELRGAFLAIVGDISPADLPVLIVDTRLDHGLVPLSSMSRDEGTLMPGLGSAVSTLRLEYEGGEQVSIPGTIYSEVGLTGNLSSNYVLAGGSFDLHGETANWGDTDILVTTNPNSSHVDFRGSMKSLSLLSTMDQVDIAAIEFSGNRRQTTFGFAVADIDIDVASVAVQSPGGAQAFGPFSLHSKTDVDGDRLSIDTSLSLENTPFGMLGNSTVSVDAELTDVDGVAAGNIADALRELQSSGSTDDFMFVVEDDLQRFLAAGFELNIDKLDISLPQGPITSKIHITLDESGSADFAWTSALLALDATIELSVPAELIDLMASADPQVHGAIGMGFLKKNGDVYEMEAAFQNGLLTVNGAPVPLPVPGLR